LRRHLMHTPRDYCGTVARKRGVMPRDQVVVPLGSFPTHCRKRIVARERSG
jgi:hypothetical protein